MARKFEPVQDIISPYAKSKLNNDFEYLFENLTIQGRTIQDIVAEGQLTDEQYAELIKVVNANVSKGEITIFDVDKNNFEIDQTMISDELRKIITGDAPVNAVPADESLITRKYAKGSVTLPKINVPYGILPKGLSFKVETANQTRAETGSIPLNIGDKIIAENGATFGVYYLLSNGEREQSDVTGWITEYTVKENRNFLIRAKLDSEEDLNGKEELISNKIFVVNDNVALKIKEFSKKATEHLEEYYDVPKLNMVQGVISGINGEWVSNQSDRVAVEYLELKKGESIRLTDTVNFDMAIWKEGDDSYQNGWNDTQFIADENIKISFMIRRNPMSRLSVEDALKVVEYISGNMPATKADIFNIDIPLNKNEMLYPSYPVWGHEYMHSWHEKLRLNQPVKMTWAGDSTTLNAGIEEDFKRYALGKKIMTLGGYDETLVTSINSGQGAQHTGNWLGGEKDEDKRTPNGFLYQDMQENPDLYIFAYGFNDGSNSHFPSLSWQERIDRFEENLIEGLERIRGAQYNKTPDDMAIILCTPIAGYDNGRGNTPPVWNDKIRPIIQKACRDYKCAFVDITARQYDHGFSGSWSTNADMVHPMEASNVDYMSMFEPLVFPRLLQN